MRHALMTALVLLLVRVDAVAAERLVYAGDRTLTEDTVWSGEVLIDGILTVAPGVTLEIRPGCRIGFTRFDSNGDGVGEHEIFSQGTILALGTAAAPILFSSAEPAPRRGDWGAVNMMVSEADNRLEHCIIEYGYRGFHAHFSRARLRYLTLRQNLRGAQFQESHVAIVASRFIDNSNGLQFRDSRVVLRDNLIARNQWGVRCVYSDVEIAGCRIADNLVNGVNIRDGKVVATGNRIVGNRRGLYLQRSQGTVAGNDLSANSEHGIYLEDSNVEVVGNRIAENGRAGIRWVNGDGRARRNLIVENGEYGLINDGLTAVDVRENWWGTAAAARIPLAVRDGLDRPGLGIADHGEPLSEPAPLPEIMVKR